jgi:RHS repeat-associated protein
MYADGGGAAALVKTEAPGDRWLSSGRVVRNNKGNPVKQYEPYFSDTPEYDDLEAVSEVGVTPLIFYDALGRVTRTEHPDGTLSGAEYDPWRHVSTDANDTVLDSIWYAERGMPDPDGPEPADAEERAAWLAAAHAGTPTVTHLDALGRPVCVVTDRGGGITTSVRSELDLTGSRSSLMDELGRRVGAGFTSMAGAPVWGWSAERGESWSFADASGRVVATWDEHDRRFDTLLDPLRRTIGMRVTQGNAPGVVLNAVVYGDRMPDAAAANLNGVVHQALDASGAVIVERLDFDGRPLSVRRRFVADYRVAPDWSSAVDAVNAADAVAAAEALLDPEPGHVVTSEYDALGRPVRVVSPDGSVVTSAYDAGGRLETLAVRFGLDTPITLLAAQSYDARGRPVSALHGNGVARTWAYDDRSLRLAATVTKRGTTVLQSLQFVHDPVGNLVQLEDAAQPTLFFANAVVEATARFAYDAAYQLVSASGRESAAGNEAPRDSGDLATRVGIPHPNDASAVRRYTEHYTYDVAGNLLSVRHVSPVNTGTWVRRYRYAYEDDASNATNRLSATSRPGDPEAGPYTRTYDYDTRGNFSSLNLSTPGELRWNALDQLERVDLGGGGTAYYAYATDGSRVRKVVERPGGIIQERRYLGALEVYSERHRTAPAHFVRTTLRLSDASGPFARTDILVRDDRGADPAVALGSPVVRYTYGSLAGSAVLETDDAGAVIGHEEYHPFGTTAIRLSSSPDGASLKRYRYAGAEHDEETGLYRMGLRYYAPWLGRWTNPDPAGFADGPNLWRYARNNPVTLSDPSGMGPPKLGDVSWEVPTDVYLDPSGSLRTDADALVRFEAWVRKAHPGREWEPGSTTIDWSSMEGKRGPTFWAKWKEGGSALPQEGDFGHVAPMRKQPKATYGTPGDKKTRQTENEHTTPHAQQSAVDPNYGESEYKKDPTVRAPRGVALDKTKGDNARSAAVKAQIAAGQPVNITDDIDMPSNREFHRANEAARQAGQPHIANPGSINRGTLEQAGARFERGKGMALPPGAVIEDPDIREWNPPQPKPGGGSGRPPGSRLGSGGPGGVASTVGSMIIPGFAEAELLGIFAAPLAAQLGVTGTLGEVAVAASAAPTTFAFAVTLPAVGGALAGSVVENAVAGLGASEEVSIGAAVLAAAGVGAIIGSFIPIPGLATLAGAAVGAVIGVIGYGLSKLFF